MDERFLIKLQAAILEAKQWAVLKMHCALVEVNVIHHLIQHRKLLLKKLSGEENPDYLKYTLYLPPLNSVDLG